MSEHNEAYEPDLIQRSVAGIDRIVEEETDLSPEQRERLVQLLGSFCTDLLIQACRESRQDEVREVEDLAREESATKQQILDYLVARRSELIVSEVDEIEYLTNMVNAARLSELEEVELELSEIEGELLFNRLDAQVVIQRLREWLATQKGFFIQ
ncbi:MAG: hypothetical protein LC803_09415 [Acidobacteria bacterium]|nr:hypothetical protein [Acidobacteriota bacterium]